jgi:16S rRNA (uracil1498-N3)-methyltransferase
VSAPVFVVDTEALRSGDRAVLDGTEGRHAVTVRRLTVGEEVVLVDGKGHSVRGDITKVIGKDTLFIDITERTEEPPPSPRITVVQALPKGDRGELAVETMTEVGVDRIVPWSSARSITQWKGERGEKALSKWRSTAREAAKQSRRTHFPEVTDLMTTKQVTALLAGADFAAVLHEDAVDRWAQVEVPASGDLILVIGPEGSLTPEELAAFTGAGAGTYRMGPTVLRTSTAGVTAAAVLLARAGRWG